MLKDRIFTSLIFIAALAVSIPMASLTINFTTYFFALSIYWLFSTLYHNLKLTSKKGQIVMDYGISYSLSISLFTGPLGLLIFETLYRFTVYFNKKRTKTKDPDEFADTFYNIGAFTLNNSIAYYLFIHMDPYFQNIPFGFWVLMIILVLVTSILSDIYLITSFFLLGDMKTFHEAIDFIKSRSVLDIGKLAFTNGLLYLFLQEHKWEMLLSLFVLNYLVSRSFISKSQNLQNKIERDKFEQMAYTDFLTGVSNRAYMDKLMAELNQTNDYIGIVVADIDHFKSINDNYNHAVGDQVIRHFAATLKSFLMKDDYLFRSGGEEFTMFLLNRNFESNVKIIEEILEGIKNSNVTVEFNNENHSISYTVSFGLYFDKVNAHVSMERGYIYADQLLLLSKKLGKNRLSSKNGTIQEVPLSNYYI